MWDLTDTKQKKGVLIGLDTGKGKVTAEESLAELHQLAETAGIVIEGKFIQKRKLPHVAHYLGKGKLAELKSFVISGGLKLVIVDDELTPTQERNLEEELRCKVIDRTRLILDIFAMHASSSVGKLQVELAQMEYYLPRLKNIWTEFSRLGGGIGTRGPGEKKIEVDRRIISDNITAIRKKLQKIISQRRGRRMQRQKSNKRNICIVGYTNSGKSTLMNHLSGAQVEVADKLFATLSPTTRKFTCGKHDVLLSDTVGFIRKLPHQLVEAFMATLEQVKEADLLLHIVDISSENYRHQIEAVNIVLGELKAMDIPVLRVYNKVDRLPDGLEYSDENQPGVYISALKNIGLDKLKCRLEEMLDEFVFEVTLKIPQSKHDVVGFIYRNAHVAECSYDEKDVIMKCCISRNMISACREYIVE
ncbi:MAG: GTPase HflX [Elusimicrobiota bacterium]